VRLQIDPAHSAGHGEPDFALLHLRPLHLCVAAIRFA
jgi:hypothetical protein